jgi:hypothetical protein
MPIRALDNLNSSSEQFPEQLDKLLHDQKWIEAVKLASDDELKELIGRLDKVRSILTPTKSRLSNLDPRRFGFLRIGVQEVPPRIEEDLQLKKDSTVSL